MTHAKTPVDLASITAPRLPYALLIGHLRSLLVAHTCALALALALRPLFRLALWFVPTPRPGEAMVWVLVVPPASCGVAPAPFMRLTWAEASSRWVGQTFYPYPADEAAPIQSCLPSLQALKALVRDGVELPSGRVQPVYEGMHMVVPHHIAAALALGIVTADLKWAWHHDGTTTLIQDAALVAARVGALGVAAEVLAGEPAVLVNGNVLWQLRSNGWTARGLGSGWPQGKEVPWSQGIERLATDLVLEASEGQVMATGEVAHG